MEGARIAGKVTVGFQHILEGGPVSAPEQKQAVESHLPNPCGSRRLALRDLELGPRVGFLRDLIDGRGVGRASLSLFPKWDGRLLTSRMVLHRSEASLQQFSNMGIKLSHGWCGGGGRRNEGLLRRLALEDGFFFKLGGRVIVGMGREGLLVMPC